ncbi:MAG: type I polyketide synthase [Shinella sp.]|nr:type I polyketide synthase [Shinella sp.]
MTVEVIGYASVAPGASSAAELFRLLREGICSVGEIPAERWDLARFWHPEQGVSGKTYTFAAGVVDDIYAFDPVVFGLSRREAMAMDPQQRLLLSVTWRALEDASVPLSSLRDETVGVYVGASSLDSANLSAEDAAAGGPYFMTGNTLSIVANRISHIFGLSGPSLTIDTACSSSLVAFDQAVRALSRGEIDTAIVGGVNLLSHPLPFVGFAQARMLSPEGRCRAYDNDASGYVRAEGAVAVVLRRSERAKANGDRSHARVLATGVNSAGRTNGISLPSQEAQATLLRKIYSEAAIDPNQIAFIEGHGTGTKVGDPAEVWAIGQVIGQKRHAPVPLGSIKTNIGHTEPASGLFGLLKAVMALENDYLPASLFFDTPNETIDFSGLNVRVTGTPLELLRGRHPRLAGINSFGFGGTNVHVVISDPEPRPSAPRDTERSRYFMASAHTANALERLLEDYKSRLDELPVEAADALVNAAGAGHTPMRHRFVARADRGAEVRNAIKDYLATKASGVAEIGETPVGEAQTAFVFSGNGAQWAGMGIEAFQRNPQFRQYFTAASALFESHLGEKLTELLVSDNLAERLSDTRVAQPLLFAVQVALAHCLLSAGIRPSVVIGHSIGEVAAAYVSGALSLVDAVAVVAVRSRCQHVTQGRGTMAAALCSEEVALDFMKRNGLDELAVAAVNARNSITISGPSEAIASLRALGRRQKIAVQPLDIDYPFHHPLIDDVKDEFLQELPIITPRDGEYEFLSTVTGDVVRGDLLTGEYWWRNVREPVHFMQAVEGALEKGCNLLIEISPRSILGNYLKETVRSRSAHAQIIGTLSRDDSKDEHDPVGRCIARAFAHGAALPPVVRNAYVALPGTPFHLEALSTPATSDGYSLFGRDATSPYTLAGWRVDPNGNAWKNHIDAKLFPDLAEHVVDGRAIMPGAGFIEIALQVAREYLDTPEVQITNFELLRPLELGATIVELSTIVSPETGAIEIRSRERLSTDDWTVHAVGRCHRLLPKAGSRAFEAFGHRQTDEISRDRIYKTAADFGLDYGPAFRLLDRAWANGDRRIDVELKPSSPPAHPFLSWSVSPMTIDAAFHGLVGLFDRLSGEADGAPYIPVRFGSVEFVNAGVPVSKAKIEIERVSAYSIKARFVLEGAAGEPVLVLEDCRFRRAWLRQHHTPASLTFHYEAMSFPSRASGLSLPVPLIVTEDAPGVEDASLLLNAAIYRSSHDILIKLADGKGRIDPRGLPGERDFKAFLVNALHVLQDAGLAETEGEEWRIESDPGLPEVGELLSEFQAERADRGVEAVIVADVREAAIRHVEQLKHSAVPTPAAPGAATLQHYRLHSPQARLRNDLVLDAVEKAIAAAGNRPLTVAQIGAAAPGFSHRLAELVTRNGSVLVVVEPIEELRRPLEVAFEASAHVIVTDGSTALPAVQLAVSTSDRLFAMLESETVISESLADAFAAGARLVAAESAPTSIQDFMFGLSPDWFSGSVAEDFHIGKLAEEADWRRKLTGHDAKSARIDLYNGPYGPLLLIEAEGQAASAPGKAFDETVVLLSAPNDAIPAAFHLALDAEEAALEEKLGEIFRTSDAKPLFLLYPGPVANADGSAALVRDSFRLTRLAGALQRAMETAGVSEPRVNLVLLLAGGAPAAGAADIAEANPVATGLWTFARVLANEYSGLEVHLVDADAGQWREALQLAASPNGNREWRLSKDGGRVEEIRAVSGPTASVELATSDFSAATIRQRTPSRVDSLFWEACDLPQPSADEVVVEVAAAGLNFRDVMWAMGLLPEEALEEGFAGATIGMELSGKVVAIGDAVTDLSVGDAVMGIGPAAFSTHAVIRRAGLAKVPAALDLTAAASVPVTFLTAWYAIVELGRARAGETILIHGAAGGVGLAAVQIAQTLGIKVIATAGGNEKRRYLRAMGVEHVFDSRSLSFVEDVRRVTGGQGVDLVLNSLFSEAMERSIELVKPFGRFLELGKRDYYSDRKIGLRPFRRNVSYFGIDADQLPLQAPDLTKRIFEELGRLFAEGRLRALPYRSFAHSEIGDAFRLMQNAGHIGKILISPPSAGKDRVARAPAGPLRLSGEGVHLVVGGIGGFGLAAAEWLASRGARRLALVTRRGIGDQETKDAVERWSKLGIAASLHACDVTDSKAVRALLEKLRADGPLKGVVHAAMILDDALLSNLTEDRFRKVIDVKARGASVLDSETRGDALDYFLMFSSATTFVGNPGQGNYVAANGYLEGLARRRRIEGLPGLAVGFGAIADRGYLARNDDVNDLLSRRLGNTSVKAATALAMVEAHMRADPGTVEAAVMMCAPMDWTVARSLKVVGTPLFEVPLRQAGSAAAGMGAESVDLAALVENKGEAEALDLIYQLVAADMAAILRVSENTLSRDKILKDVGLDSLMAVELGLSFKEKTGFDMPLTSVGDSTTIDHVVRKLYEKVARSGGQEEETTAPLSDADALVEQHLDASRRASEYR